MAARAATTRKPAAQAEEKPDAAEKKPAAKKPAARKPAAAKKETESNGS